VGQVIEQRPVPPRKRDARLLGLEGEFEVVQVGPVPGEEQAIVVVATPRAPNGLDEKTLLASCRDRLPVFMLPAKIDIRPGPLPKNPNGKIDRKLLNSEFVDFFRKKT